MDWPDAVILINILININHLRECREDFNNMGQIIIIVIIQEMNHSLLKKSHHS